MCKRKQDVSDNETTRFEGEKDEEYLERLKIIYDLKKQKIAHQNRIYQVLLGVVAAFGAFEFIFCLCQVSNPCWEVLISIVGIVFTANAVMFSSIALLYSNQKDIEKSLNNAKKIMDIKSAIDHYAKQISALNAVSRKKKLLLTPSIVFTVIVGLFSLACEIASLII